MMEDITTRRNTHRDRPEDRSSLYYERAKQLSILSTNTSIELERQLREVYKALSYQSEDVKLYLLLGKVYKANLDLSSALFCYRYVLKKDPSSAIAQKALVNLLLLKGKECMLQAVEMSWESKYFAARAFFDEALEYAKDHEEILILKTVCHVHCNELTEAFETINKVLQPHKSPKAEAFILRAKINWGRGLVEQGNHDIRTAAGLDSSHPEVVAYIERSYAKSEKLYTMALKLFAKERFKDALEHINHAIFLTNEDVKLYIIQSKIYRMLHEHQPAYESILKAKAIFDIRYEDGHTDMPDISLQIHLILNEIAIEHASAGNYQKAILLYNKIIKDASHASNLLDMDYKYHVNRGDCYRALGLQALPDAILDYKRALEMAPDDWNVNIRLSLSFYLLGLDLFNHAHFLEAEDDLSKAIKYNPKVSEYWVLRGKARYYTNNYKGAYEDFKQALQLDPENLEVKQRLQQFEADMDMLMTSPAKAKKIEFKTSYTTEKSVQRLKPTDEDMVAVMLHPQQVQHLPTIKLLHQAEHPPPLPSTQVAVAVDRSIDNSGHIVRKALPSWQDRHDVHHFKKAIVATEALHEKSVAVVREYINKPSIQRGPMWDIIATAKKLADKQSRDRDKQLAKHVNDVSTKSSSTTRKRTPISRG